MDVFHRFRVGEVPLEGRIEKISRVLHAVEEIISETGDSFPPVAYFGALLSTLETSGTSLAEEVRYTIYDRIE